jgi:type III pantothenate kinase
MTQALNLLAVSVGNTCTRLGAFVEGELTETATLENGRQRELTDVVDRAFGPLREKEDTVVLMSSVNPKAGDAFSEALRQQLSRPIHRVEQDVNIPIGRQLDREALVGEDRLLNAAAAFDVLNQACVVVDAGTAITVDFIDGAGTFHGGAIAPGAQLMLDSLKQRTGLLPETEFAAPREPIGHNTVEAMRSGVFYALRGMVQQLVEQYADEAGAFPLVVATGGDANVLFRDWELVDRVVPELTLRGLAVTLRRAMEGGDDDQEPQNGES